MRFRSTGLGKAELRGRMTDLTPTDRNQLVFTMDTYEPVQWCLKASIQREEVIVLLKSLLDPLTLLHIIRAIFYLKKNPNELEDIMDKSI